MGSKPTQAGVTPAPPANSPTVRGASAQGENVYVVPRRAWHEPSCVDNRTAHECPPSWTSRTGPLLEAALLNAPCDACSVKLTIRRPLASGERVAPVCSKALAVPEKDARTQVHSANTGFSKLGRHEFQYGGSRRSGIEGLNARRS